jgi:hypothetical protein
VDELVVPPPELELDDDSEELELELESELDELLDASDELAAESAFFGGTPLSTLAFIASFGFDE